jgi:hypothetical protein
VTQVSTAHKLQKIRDQPPTVLLAKNALQALVLLLLARQEPTKHKHSKLTVSSALPDTTAKKEPLHQPFAPSVTTVQQPLVAQLELSTVTNTHVNLVITTQLLELNNASFATLESTVRPLD